VFGNFQVRLSLVEQQNHLRPFYHAMFARTSACPLPQCLLFFWGQVTRYPSAHIQIIHEYAYLLQLCTRLSAGGVADEWVTQMLRQTDAKVFKKYSQMKLQMKREALTRLNRQAGDADSSKNFDTVDDE
jgi:hypothetical protein